MASLTKKLYLVHFTYDHYCQGYEEAKVYVLVHAMNWGEACAKIRYEFENARNFENYTIE